MVRPPPGGIPRLPIVAPLIVFETGTANGPMCQRSDQDRRRRTVIETWAARRETARRGEIPMTGNAEAADNARERPAAASQADREAANEEDLRRFAASRAVEDERVAASLHEAERAQRSRDDRDDERARGMRKTQRMIDADAARERIVAIIAHEVRMRVLDDPSLLGELLALLGITTVDDLT